MLSVCMAYGTMQVLQAQAEEMTLEENEMSPYEESDFVSLYENPDGFISGSTLIFNHDINFRDRLSIDLKRMREKFYVNTVGVYDLINMNAEDRDFFFQELRKNEQKVVVRIENYDASAFCFDKDEDVDWVMNYYEPLLSYLKDHLEEIAYFAINMPVDDETVANNFTQGRNDPEWADNQVSYADEIVKQLRAYFAPDDVTLYISVFYGWDYTYPTPSYVDISNPADGYFLNNYVYPTDGVIQDETAELSELINQNRLQQAMDLFMSQYPDAPKIIEYGFHTLEFNNGKPNTQTAGLVQNAAAKSKALKAITNYYKNGTSQIEGEDKSFGFRGSLYFAQNLYKEEGNPLVLNDWALDYPNQGITEAEDESSVLYYGGVTPEDTVVKLTQTGNGIGFFNLREGEILRIKYSADTDGTITPYINGAKQEKITYTQGEDQFLYVNSSIPLQGSVDLRRESGDGEIWIDSIYVYDKYEAEIGAYQSAERIQNDSNASGEQSVKLNSEYSTLEYEHVKEGTKLILGYGSDSDGALELYINDVLSQTVPFEATIEDGILGYEEKELSVYIPEDAKITWKQKEGNVFFDYMQVKGVYEAEYASGKYNGAHCVETAGASQNAAVTGVTEVGASIVFSNGMKKGDQLKIKYANGTGSERQLTLLVNGNAQTVKFPATSNAQTFEDQYISVTILEEATVILQCNAGDNGEGLFIDYISSLGWYEAEAGIKQGEITADQNASNGKAVLFQTNAGNIEFDCESEGSQIQFTYASEEDTTLNLYCNDRQISVINLPGTGGAHLYKSLVMNADIPGGAVISIRRDTSGPEIRMDKVRVIADMEAENGNLKGNASIYADSGASGGQGVELKTSGDEAEYTNLKSGTGLKINYTCEEDGQLSIYVNGQKKTEVTFSATESWKKTYNTRYVNISIPAGAAVSFVFEDNSKRVRIDYFTVLGVQEAENSKDKSSSIESVEDLNASGNMAVTGFGDVGASISFSNQNGASSVQFTYKSDNDAKISVYLKYKNHVDLDTTAMDKVGTLEFPATGGEYRTESINANVLGFMDVVLIKEETDTADSTFYLDYISFSDHYEAESAKLSGGAAVNYEGEGSSALSKKQVIGTGVQGSSVTFEQVKAGNRLIIGYTCEPMAAESTYSLYIAENGTDYQYSQTLTFEPTGSWSGPFAERIVDITIPYGAGIRLQCDDGDSPVHFDYMRVDGIYEAENGNFNVNAQIWYTPSNASNSHYVWGFPDIGCSAEVINVRDGNQINVKYAEGPADPGGYGQLGLFIDSKYMENLQFTHTGSWDNFKELTTTQQVKEGSNIKLENIDQLGKTINLDYIEVKDTRRKAVNANLYGDKTIEDAGVLMNGQGAKAEFIGLESGSQMTIAYESVLGMNGQLSVYINGIKKTVVSLPADKTAIPTSIPVPQNAVVTFQYDENDSPVRLDYVEVSGVYGEDNKYEAEDGSIQGSIGLLQDEQASSGWVVNAWGEQSKLEFPAVNKGKSILIQYKSTQDVQLELYVNGKKKQSVFLKDTDGIMATSEVKVHIPQGVSLSFVNESTPLAKLELDYFIISDKYEAEYSEMHGQSNDNPPILPQVENVPTASNGKATACFWAPADGSGYFEFKDVSEGTWLTISYASGDTNARKLSLYVNDEDYMDITFPAYEGGDWNGTYNQISVPVEIQEGASLKLQKDPGDSEVNFDYIKVEGTYEAEDGIKLGTAYSLNDYAGDIENASRGIAVGGIGTSGSGVIFKDVVSGNKLDIVYACENEGELYLYVNGGEEQKIVLPATGSYTGTYGVVSVFSEIEAGDELKFLYKNASGEKAVHLDKISVYESEEEAPTFYEFTASKDGLALLLEYTSQIESNLLLKIGDGTTEEIPVLPTGGSTIIELKKMIKEGDLIRFDFETDIRISDVKVTDRYEAEYADFAGIDNDGNLTGVESFGGASGGKAVCRMWGDDSSYVEFKNVAAASEIILGYANGDSTNSRQISLYVNDEKVDVVTLPFTGGWGGNGEFGEVVISYPIAQGSNIQFRRDAGDNADVFIDYITLRGNGEEAEKEALEKKYAELKEITNGDQDPLRTAIYTKDSFEYLQAALEEAENILNSDAESEEIKTALTLLMEAEENLVSITKLREAVNEAKINKGEEFYLTASWKNYQEELEKLINILSEASLTKDQVEEARKQAENLHLLLIEAADKESLQLLLSELQQIGNEDGNPEGSAVYTKDSYEHLQNTMEAAYMVYEDPDALEEEIGQIIMDLIQAQIDLVDISNLRNQIKIAEENETNDQSIYTVLSWTSYQEEIAALKQILQNPSLTNEEVNNAVSRAEKTKEILVKAGNKNALEALITQSKQEAEADYTQESWNRLKLALEAAILIFQDKNAVQAEVDSAYEALKNAFSALVEVKKVTETEADKTILKDMIKSAKEKIKDNYTSDSWEKLMDALEYCEKLDQDHTVSQTMVDAAVELLKKSIEELETIKTEPAAPKESEKPQEQKPSKSITPSNTQSSNSPDTGDNMPIFIYFWMVSAALFILLVNRKKILMYIKK